MFNYGMNTQPYAYQNGYQSNYTPYYGNTMQQATQPQMQQANTNEVFVNGYEEVRSYRLPPNSNYIFLDNDKALLYEKIVDSKGQFEVKVYEIKEKTNHKAEQERSSVDLSGFVKQGEFEAFKTEIKAQLDRMASVEVLNGESNNEKQ